MTLHQQKYERHDWSPTAAERRLVTVRMTRKLYVELVLIVVVGGLFFLYVYGWLIMLNWMRSR